MKFLSTILFLVMISAGNSFAWYDTKFDTVETKWSNGNLQEFYTRAWFLGNEKGFRPHGRYNSWYENGQMKEQGHYDWNVKMGIWITWYEDGSPKEEATFINGDEHGQYIEWHPDNTIKTIGHYKNGQRHGLWTSRKPGEDINNLNLSVISVEFYFNDDPVAVLEKEQGWFVHEEYSYYNNDLDLWVEWKRHNSFDWLNNYLWFDIGKKTNDQKEGEWIRLNHRGEIVKIENY